MQSRLGSFVEASLNTASGFLISWAMWVWVVAPLFGIQSSGHQGFWITVLFTITSLTRSYIWRRIAERWSRRK